MTSSSLKLQFFLYHFFCNITKYDSAKFHVKSIFLTWYTQEETLCAPLHPRGMIRQKYPRAERVKEKLLRSITVNYWNVAKKAFISTFFGNLTPSQALLNAFNNSCQKQIWRGPLGGCFCKVFCHFKGQSTLIF